MSPFKTAFNYPNISKKGRVTIVNSNISESVKLYDRVTLNNVIIKDFTYVGGGSKLMNCKIGKFCSIAPNVKIGLGIHPTDFISTYPGFYSNRASGVTSIYSNTDILEHKEIIIKNDVWIGDGVTIMDGVTIGNGAVIAAGAVVTKNIPDYAVVGGVPAKIIKYRFTQKEIFKLNTLQWWNNDIKQIKKRASLFLNPSKFFQEF